MIRRLLQRLFRSEPRKDREVRFVPYAEGDRLLKLNEGWRLAEEEDRNLVFGMVWLERDAAPEQIAVSSTKART